MIICQIIDVEDTQNNVKYEFFQFLMKYLVNCIQVPPRKAIILLSALDNKWNDLSENKVNFKNALHSVNSVVFENIDVILYDINNFVNLNQFKDLYNSLYDINISQLFDIFDNLYNYSCVFNIDLVEYMINDLFCGSGCELIRLHMHKKRGSWSDWFISKDISFIIERKWNFDLSNIRNRPYVISNVPYGCDYFNIVFDRWHNDVINVNLYVDALYRKCIEFFSKRNAINIRILYLINDLDVQYSENPESIYYMFNRSILNSYLNRMNNIDFVNIIGKLMKFKDVLSKIK